MPNLSKPFAEPDVRVEPRPDGSLLLRSAEPLHEHPPTVLHSFRAWARQDPGHVLIAERNHDGDWRELTYGDAEQRALAVGQGLLDLGLNADRPLVVLSGNSVDHLIVTLGAMCAGVPVAPTSVAYSLMSQDHGRLREIAELTTPGAVYAEDGNAFSDALQLFGGVIQIVSRGSEADVTLDDLCSMVPGGSAESAYASLGPASVAKLLFTSGSTGSPKGVITTHGMLASNQQMMRQVWPFLTEERPVIVDWLPWSHTFGGSHNLNMVLVNGGTLYVDAGRPAPTLFGQTLANLADVPPTLYFNVPAGYAQLVPALEADPVFAERFFSRLRLSFNAAAALPSALRERLVAVGERTSGRRIPVTGSWGLTETAPAVTNAHFEFSDARSIGTPLPGAEVLLRPQEEQGAFEVLVRGPMVTPGYHRRPDLTAECFDEEGFYKTGDAVSPADPEDPNLGLVFRGRLAEDFKLSTGTFVRVGAVRTALLSMLPVLADAVIAGENRDEVCALVWVNPAEALRLLGREPVTDGELVTDPDLHAHIAESLDMHRATTGSAGRVARLLVMSRPAGLDEGEITDKGYVNQRRVLANRSHLVELLYDQSAVGVVSTGSSTAGVNPAP
jgi:feruloyl-CoA synthase